MRLHCLLAWLWDRITRPIRQRQAQRQRFNYMYRYMDNSIIMSVIQLFTDRYLALFEMQQIIRDISCYSQNFTTSGTSVSFQNGSWRPDTTSKGFTHSTSYYIYVTELSSVCKLYFSEIDILITLLGFKQQMSDRTPEGLEGCPCLRESEKTLSGSRQGMYRHIRSLNQAALRLIRESLQTLDIYGRN